SSSGGGGGGLQDILGGLLGGGSAGSAGTKASGMNLGALAAVLAPLLGNLLKGGGLSKLVQNAQASGLSAQADSWVGTGDNQSISGQEIRGVIGDDAVRQVAEQAGISEDEAADVLAQVVPQVVSGLTPGGQVPSDDELGQLAAKFGG
ncbi:MAG TPA: YidB family protein, partial [Gaiella sp.]